MDQIFGEMLMWDRKKETRKMPDDTPIYNQVGRLIFGEDWVEQCTHGLSLWLCEGPQHYPLDQPHW